MANQTNDNIRTMTPWLFKGGGSFQLGQVNRETKTKNESMPLVANSKHQMGKNKWEMTKNYKTRLILKAMWVLWVLQQHISDVSVKSSLNDMTQDGSLVGETKNVMAHIYQAIKLYFSICKLVNSFHPKLPPFWLLNGSIRQYSWLLPH